jgi:crotonobetainyl-CoA:carnitine CoA-transferase CaiB-like acyl-CoA transferase
VAADSASPPLAGVRVLDFSRVLAGPYCTMVLADLGADVIKIERPGSGDETRSWGPPFAGGEAGYFLSVNRGKRSLALDLADARSAPAVRALTQGADVVIENFRAGVAARLGLSYEVLRQIRPDLVYCSITGFGSGREPETRAGYDFVVQAESGLMSITGERDGTPMKAGVALVDVLTGVHAAVGIVAALQAREATGEGRRIEVSLLDSALASLVNVAQGALLTGREAARYGNAHPSIVPYEPLRASDGWVAVAAANDSLWRALCAACERPDLLEDDRFATNPGRVAHREELIAALAPTFAERSADEWLERLEARGVPAGKIRGVGEALGAAAAAGRPATVTVAHPTAGTLELVASPIRLEPESAGAPTPPPLLGEHTLEVLAEAGVDGKALVAAGVAAQGATSTRSPDASDASVAG